jgi:hypothetical protein
LDNSPQGTVFIENYWVSGLCPSSGILNTRKHVSETGSVSVLRGREGDTYYVGSLRKSRPQSLDKVQKLNNSVIHRYQNPSDSANSFHVFPPEPLIFLCQMLKLSTIHYFMINMYFDLGL